MTTLRARLLSPASPDTLTYVPDGVVVIDDHGRITEVSAYDGRPVDEDLRPDVLMPGFVDAHVHYPQTRIVGAATGPLLEWLDRSAFPEEMRFAARGHAEAVAETFCDRLAAAGTTLALAYGPVYADATDALLAEADRRGLRLIAGPVLMDEHCPPELTVPADRALPALDALADRWHGHDGDRLQVAAIPRFALCCSRELMAGAGELAARRGLLVSTHLSENPEECRVARERFGAADYLSIYEDAGLVHDRSVYAHCIHLSDDEWDRFTAAGAVVAHCPDSNAFLGSGHMPIAEALQRGARVTLGSDVAGGRSFRIPRAISSAYDNALAVGAEVSPARLLWWATRGGALALGAHTVGKLEVGFDADLTCVACPPWAEREDEVVGWCLFDADAPPVRGTWVRGRRVR